MQSNISAPSPSDILRQLVQVKEDGDIKFPFLRNIYDFFAPRTRTITAWSFGFSYGGFEAEVLENTGCEMKIFDGRKDASERFAVFKRVSETHEKEEADPAWAEQLLDHWFLVKKAHFDTSIPFEFDGSLSVKGETISVKKIDTEVYPQLDLLKIDYPEFESALLHSVLNAGYRPGLIWVHWSKHPDEDVKSMLSAGHLQSVGYTLFGMEGNYFLYKFTDNCLYEVCSWALPGVPNPMIDTIFKNVSVATPESKEEETSSTSR